MPKNLIMPRSPKHTPQTEEKTLASKFAEKIIACTQVRQLTAVSYEVFNALLNKEITTEEGAALKRATGKKLKVFQAEVKELRNQIKQGKVDPALY